jgi:hypothetical protein
MRRNLLYAGVLIFIIALIFTFAIPFPILEYILVVIGVILVILGLIL